MNNIINVREDISMSLDINGIIDIEVGLTVRTRVSYIAKKPVYLRFLYCDCVETRCKPKVFHYETKMEKDLNFGTYLCLDKLEVKTENFVRLSLKCILVQSGDSNVRNFNFSVINVLSQNSAGDELERWK